MKVSSRLIKVAGVVLSITMTIKCAVIIVILHWLKVSSSSPSPHYTQHQSDNKSLIIDFSSLNLHLMYLYRQTTAAEETASEI